MRRLLIAALLLAAHGCGRCGRAQPGPVPELARVLPRNAQLLVLIPDLDALGERIKRLERLKLASFVAQLQGATDVSELVSSAMLQLGVDLRSHESMLRAGLDPPRGAAVVWLKEGVYVAAAVKDKKAFRETVRALARDRLGAGVATEVGGGLAFSRAPDGPPELSLLLRDGYGFVATGSLDKLPALSAVEPSEALSTDDEYQKDLARLPAKRQVVIRLPPASSLSPSTLHGATVSLALEEDALTVFARQPWPNTQRAVEILRTSEGANLIRLAAPDAFLVARSQGSPEGLAPLWSLLSGESVARAVRESGIDLQEEIFENLKPGLVLSLSLAPTASLATGIPELDVRRTNPFAYVHLIAAGEVRDPARTARLLERLPPLAKRFGATLTPSTRDGQRVYLTRYAQGEGVHLALIHDKVVAATPVARLDEAISRAKTARRGGLAGDPAFQTLFRDRPLAVAVDLRGLSESVRALPSSAWGVGGFAVKAAAMRWLDATDDLHAVTLWAAEADGAVEYELQLRFQPEDPEQPVPLWLEEPRPQGDR